MNRVSPSLSVPVQRASSLRASTISPLALPRFSTERKTSLISIENFVDDAARQFDQLTDGSGCSLNEHCLVASSTKFSIDITDVFRSLEKRGSARGDTVDALNDDAL